MKFFRRMALPRSAADHEAVDKEEKKFELSKPRVLGYTDLSKSQKLRVPGYMRF